MSQQSQQSGSPVEKNRFLGDYAELAPDPGYIEGLQSGDVLNLQCTGDVPPGGHAAPDWFPQKWGHKTSAAKRYKLTFHSLKVQQVPLIVLSSPRDWSFWAPAKSGNWVTVWPLMILHLYSWSCGVAEHCFLYVCITLHLSQRIQTEGQRIWVGSHWDETTNYCCAQHSVTLQHHLIQSETRASSGINLGLPATL